MTPGRDTDPTPVQGEPPELPQAWSPPGPRPRRSKRSTLAGVRRAVAGLVKAACRGLLWFFKKVGPPATAVIVAYLVAWTARIDQTAGRAQDTAESAEAKGELGARVAKTAKVEVNAGYGATIDKDAAIVEDMKKLVARVNSLEAELERLKARAGKPRRRRAPITLSPKTTEPPPPTPAAAAEEQATPTEAPR